jgi:hypothetical protein
LTAGEQVLAGAKALAGERRREPTATATGRAVQIIR